MNIRPIKNHIIFEFLDTIDSNKQFTETTSSGIHVVGHFDNSAKEPRWGRVLAAGPDVAVELQEPNCEVLIDNLRWTSGVVYEGKTYWRTDDRHVLAFRYVQ